MNIQETVERFDFAYTLWRMSQSQAVQTTENSTLMGHDDFGLPRGVNVASLMFDVDDRLASSPFRGWPDIRADEVRSLLP